ncbi:hypothetical protein D3C76_1520620 [compost metagenome]
MFLFQCQGKLVQAANMIRMNMGDQNGVDLVEGDPQGIHGRGGCNSAVDQQSIAAAILQQCVVIEIVFGKSIPCT